MQAGGTGKMDAQQGKTYAQRGKARWFGQLVHRHMCIRAPCYRTCTLCMFMQYTLVLYVKYMYIYIERFIIVL